MKRTSTARAAHSGLIRPARAFAPGHITGFFEIDDGDADPLDRGSRGAGISLAAGAVAEVELRRADKAGPRFCLNGECDAAAPVSRRVVALFLEAVGEREPIAIEIRQRVSLPAGAGFGSSGAGALSLALALNEAWDSRLDAAAAARIAHRAEIDCRTGLGTVLASTVGGLEIRGRAGAPGRGEVTAFPLPEGLLVWAAVFGPLATARALADPSLRRKINEAGGELRRELEAEPTAPRFLSLARRFSEATGLVSPRVRRVLDDLDQRGIIGAMTMFGEAAYTIIEESLRPGLEDIAARAEAAGALMFESRVSPEGGKIIHA